jgi:hypothetical protein
MRPRTFWPQTQTPDPMRQGGNLWSCYPSKMPGSARDQSLLLRKSSSPSDAKNHWAGLLTHSRCRCCALGLLRIQTQAKWISVVYRSPRPNWSGGEEKKVFQSQMALGNLSAFPWWSHLKHQKLMVFEVLEKVMSFNLSNISQITLFVP